MTLFDLLSLVDPIASSQQRLGGQLGQSDTGPIKAPAPMWRCSRIMHMQRELHPTILASLEGIVDQVCFCFDMNDFIGKIVKYLYVK